MEQWLTIGEVAQRAAAWPRRPSASTSGVGLVHAERTQGGQRRFRRDVLRRVAFVRVAQRVGLSLEEIAGRPGRAARRPGADTGGLAAA